MCKSWEDSYPFANTTSDGHVTTCLDIQEQEKRYGSSQPEGRYRLQEFEKGLKTRTEG
jgi:hypothetical protein